MDAIVSAQALSSAALDKISSAHAVDLRSIFDHYADHIKILSLDCFSTLIWRKTASPRDVFYDMCQRPAFKEANITAVQRVTAEAIARQAKLVKQGIFEVSLEEIYQIGFPALSKAQQEKLIEEEVAAEIDACYGFPAMIALIRKARASGKKIIIVSNTYFTENQLRNVLTQTLPADVISAIDLIFCSCDYGKSKNNGLFADILLKLGEPANSILHIGDNRAADFDAPKKVSIHALHFLQHDKKTLDLLRMQHSALTLTDSMIRSTRSLSSPFRGVLANACLPNDKAEIIAGYMSMGPVMYAFARFICDDVEQLKRDGKRPKVLFLMRDGYLPARACEAIMGEPIGKDIRISRFTAVAASFRSAEDIDQYLAEMISTVPLPYICNQLFLPEDIKKSLIQKLSGLQNHTQEFIKFIQQEETLQYILSQSAAFRARLIRYLKNQVDIEAGETLVFVDIGYMGTAQKVLTDILKSEFGVDDVIGRYLLSLNMADWQSTRRGLIDPSWCDDRTVTMLAYNFSLIEELCCGEGGSVIDYDNEGNAICSQSSIHEEQRNKIKLIQNECVQFVRDAKQFFQDANTTISLQSLRDAALAELGRRIYMPTAIETEYLHEFKHDQNSGTSAIYRLFNTDSELTHLRRKGLLFKNQHPYGLRSASFELSLALMAQRRFGFDISLEDRSLRREWLKIVIMQHQKPTEHLLNATPTFDGYFSLCLPLSAGQQQVGILFGLNYQMFQIESAELIKSDAYSMDFEAQHTRDMLPKLLFNQIEHVGGKVFKTISKMSTIIMTLTPEVGDNSAYVYRLVFRPLVMQE